MPLRILLGLCVLSVLAPTSDSADAIAPIARVLPPEGIEIPADVRTRLETRLAAIKKRLDEVKEAPLKPDVEIFAKAVELALLHREFYVEKDFAKADWALEEANKRLDLLAKGESPWTRATGTIALGYRSSIDSSAQPYGLVISDDHDFDKPCPLYVWLHGRGDKNTDLHFLQERATRPGQVTPPSAIVAHPFGRHCIGYKGPGEVDVRDVVRAVRRRYKIDADRIVLIGFSMGGAGAWQVGAHSASDWVAISPGAGFAETAQYQRLTPDRYPPWYEQKLWGVNDVPNYVRNLFNTELIAYSGELDRQIQAARIMEEAFKAEGRTLTHLIGPGVEHKYEPNTFADLSKRLEAIVGKGREKFAKEVHLQTRTLRYPQQGWVMAERLEQHWVDSRIDGVKSENKYEITTKNVARLSLVLPPDFTKDTQFTVDGQSLPPSRQGLRLPQRGRKLVKLPDGKVGPGELSKDLFPGLASFEKRNGNWQWLPQQPPVGADLEKQPGLTGPIDDLFNWPFLVITPSGKSKNPRFQAWVDFELTHFRDRWRALMRGEPPMKTDAEFTEADGNRPLVLWGDPDSNRVMARMLDKSFVDFQDGRWRFGGQAFDGDRYVPALIYPRRAPGPFPGGAPPFRGTVFRYTVLNSGLTFREAHDRTNSLQNPKLPDWAIIDITQPPDAESPGRIHDADFFDEQWQLKRQPKAP